MSYHESKLSVTKCHNQSGRQSVSHLERTLRKVDHDHGCAKRGTAVQHRVDLEFDATSHKEIPAYASWERVEELRIEY